MKNEDKIRELCETVKNECDTCYSDIDFDCGDCIDCTQGGKAILAKQILELLREELDE